MRDRDKSFEITHYRPGISLTSRLVGLPPTKETIASSASLSTHDGEDVEFARLRHDLLYSLERLIYELTVVLFFWFIGIAIIAQFFV